ncbi:glutamate 5-kinase [Aquipuribacter nitratireducens]|uniref:Glutamate 5-kinase n=1 Tax=Aquipuribacter nitratireducens TaxID=650104 RepID=A0ABW0GKA2_9MICO
MTAPDVAGSVAAALLTGPGTLVVKVGSSSLASDAGIDGAQVDRLVELLAARRALGPDRQLVVVTSGAIAAGLPALGLPRRPADLAGLQAAASVGQGRLQARWALAFERHDMVTGQVLLDLDDLVRRNHYLNARATLARLLQLGAVPVVNENDTVATDEIRFGDNDRLAAFVAHLVGASALVLLTDVDALYDRPPTRPGAVRLRTVEDPQAVGADLGTGAGSAVGTGGMRTKVDAAAIAADAGVPTFVTATSRYGDAVAGADVGTWFRAAERAMPARILWLTHVAVPKGRLTLDAGAVRAVVERGASLLPAGIRAVSGGFDVGAVVDLCDEAGGTVARGVVSYGAAELPRLLGRSTHDLRADLGPGYGREVVHRDDLVVVPAPGLP